MYIPDKDLNTTQLKELNLRLQSTGQTVMCRFGIWKGFVSKLDVYTRDIRTATFATLNTSRLYQWITKLMQLKLICT